MKPADRQVKPQERELRNSVYQSRDESGLRALVQLLDIRKAQALTNLRHARGLEELVRWQTAYNEAQSSIELITVRPIQIEQRDK